MNINIILIRNQPKERGHCLSKEVGSSSPPCLHTQDLGTWAGAFSRLEVVRTLKVHRRGVADTWRELDERDFWRVQRTESQAEGEGGKEKMDQNPSSLVLVLKWPQMRQETDGPFLMLSQRSGERKKGKNKYHYSQKFKNKPKNLKDKQLVSEVPPASRAF